MGNSISWSVITGIVFSSIAIIIFIIRRHSLAVWLGISTAPAQPAEGQEKQNKAKEFTEKPIALWIAFISSILGIISFAKDSFKKDNPQPITTNNIITDNHPTIYNNQASTNVTQAHPPVSTKPSMANNTANTNPASQKPAVPVVSGIHIVSGQNQPDDAATQQVTDAIQANTGTGSNTHMPIIQGQFTLSPPTPGETINGQQTVSYKITLRLQFYKPDGITGCNLRVFDTTITAYNDSPVDNIKQQALTSFCRELTSQLGSLLPACQ